jgi:hypothetical protein
VAELSQKVKNTLDEARILVLGTQVLLGFQYRAFMEPGYERLPAHTQRLEMVGLFLLLASLGFLLAPAARHRLVERGADSTRLIRFTTLSLRCALVPFATAVAADLFSAGEHLGGLRLGVAAGTCAFAVTLGLWYALPFSLRSPPHSVEERMSEPGLEQRIQQVLTEARVVLPGAQAMLGFQLAMMLMDAFEKLSPAARGLHFASLCFVALATALLMAPPAFHRIAERGDETARLERFAGAMNLAALATLAAGLSLDLAVVSERAFGSLLVGLVLAAVCFAALIGGWFGVSLALRRSLPAPSPRRAEA